LYQFLKSKHALTEPGRTEDENRRIIATELEKNLASLGRLGILVAAP
jgi:hypothetical protein